jgi:C1A family cysteine protease
MMTAMNYLIKAGGQDTEASYPTGVHSGGCKFTPAGIGAKITSWKFLSKNEDELAQQLIETGPIAVAFNAAKLFSYHSGVLTADGCDPTRMTHAVLLVGFGTEGGKKYWLVKNSWNTSWGISGYFMIERGNNACGIATVPLTAVHA